MSDAINEDVEFKKKLYRKKLFFIGKKCYTIHSKKIVSVETDCLKDRSKILEAVNLVHKTTEN